MDIELRMSEGKLLLFNISSTSFLRLPLSHGLNTIVKSLKNSSYKIKSIYSHLSNFV